MGALLGLGAGIGLVLIWRSMWSEPPPSRSERSSTGRRARELLAEAGLQGVAPAALAASAMTTGALALIVALIITRSAAVAAAFGLLAVYAPYALVRARAHRRRDELREVWPDAVDHLASAVRAGLSLPEALAQIGTRGPQALREPFARFGEDYRTTGRFDDCLDRLKASLADPTGDRVLEAVRLARQVGGTELGRLLRTLSNFLRADARTRGEIESRQSWTINAARLSVASPWIVLGFLSLRADTVARYDSRAGVLVLVIGAAVCVISYRIMLRIGRLPREERLMR